MVLIMSKFLFYVVMVGVTFFNISLLLVTPTNISRAGLLYFGFFGASDVCYPF